MGRDVLKRYLFSFGLVLGLLGVVPLIIVSFLRQEKNDWIYWCGGLVGMIIFLRIIGVALGFNFLI